MNYPKQIILTLPTGDPQELKIIEAANFTGKVIIFQRKRWLALNKLESFSLPGVYILFNHSQPGESPKLYVGQASISFKDRLGYHSNAGFLWQYGLCIYKNGINLTETEISWLESMLMEEAINAGRFLVTNRRAEKVPTIPKIEHEIIKIFFDEILCLLKASGFTFFTRAYPVSFTR